jgi:cytochrome c peroxidase
MKKSSYGILAIALILITFSACFHSKEFDNNGELQGSTLVLPATPYDYDTHSPTMNVSGTDRNLATLGRVLFYDRILSVNNTVACASCHRQENAFSDKLAGSIGFGDRVTGRNSMPIINVRAMGNRGFFWDLRVMWLDSMVVKPIQNHIEMGFDEMDNVVKKINSTPYYPDLFTKAFGTSEVSQARVQSALGEFLRSLNSYNSKYDVGSVNNFSNFTAEELLGKELVTEKLYCKHCHNTIEFRPFSYKNPNSGAGGGANIGLDMSYTDKGIATEGHEGFFKIPTLRNVELTAPYMHDGRFATLEEVVEHYNSGVQNHADLSFELKLEERQMGLW